MIQGKPAKNYRPRARRVLGVLLAHARTITGPRWREPTNEEMEHFIDGFHHICNWGLDGAARLGYPVTYFHGPLTETQLRAVERVFLGQERTDETIL